MKIKRIIVQNFQSIKDLEIVFDEKGVYRFKGLNNSGKSALLKAITFLMRNVSNHSYKNYIRDEEDTFQVSMDDFEGNYVILSRGAVDFYEWSINGEKGRMDKTGGKVPQEVKKFFNLYIEDEKTNECLNIRLPREVLLFIDTSFGDNAMMVQKALGTEDYMIGIKQVDKRGREIKKEVKILEKYKEKEEGKLEEVRVEFSELDSAVSEMERYENTLRQDYENFKDVKGLIEDTLEVSEKQRDLKEKKKLLDDMDFKGIKEDLDVLVLIEDVLKKASKEQGLKESIKGKKGILDNVDLGELKERIGLVDLVDVTMDKVRVVARHQKVIRLKNKELQEVKDEIKEFKEELEVCPFCGGDLDEKHIH